MMSIYIKMKNPFAMYEEFWEIIKNINLPSLPPLIWDPLPSSRKEHTTNYSIVHMLCKTKCKNY